MNISRYPAALFPSIIFSFIRSRGISSSIGFPTNWNIKLAKYVANIGGDWWVEKGATWKPDWSANKDVSLGQFRTLTKEWKTLEMCSAPVEVAKNILGNKEFLQ